MNNGNEYKNSNYEKMKCIWMASQVIEYKLCDNEFDCENCMFDKVMRNLMNKKEAQITGTTNAAEKIYQKLQNIKYDTNIIYLRNNIIAKEICPNTFYLGINPILICFLDNVSSFRVSERGENIIAGQKVIQILGDWGTINISAPVNFMMYDKVGDPNDTSSKSHWFAIIGDTDKQISNSKLEKEEWDKLHGKALSFLEDVKSLISKVGDTMMDGGTQIKFLYQIVGNKKYVDFLNSLGV